MGAQYSRTNVTKAPEDALESCQVGLSQQNVLKIFRLPTLKSLELYEITMEELQNHMSHGNLISIDYVTFCFERIRQIDQYLEGVIETSPEALTIVSNLDKERQAGHVRSKLPGIPILVKDVRDTSLVSVANLIAEEHRHSR